MMGRRDSTEGKFAWHVHHSVLVERLTEPLENRIEYIQKSKPPEEIPTRLERLRLCRNQERVGELLAAYEPAERQAWDAYESAKRQAWDAYESVQQQARNTYKAVVRQARDPYWAVVRQALDAYGSAKRQAWDAYKAVVRQARDAYEAVVRQAREPLEQLHAEECPDCPWDGTTLLPEGKNDDGTSWFDRRHERFLTTSLRMHHAQRIPSGLACTA